MSRDMKPMVLFSGPEHSMQMVKQVLEPAYYVVRARPEPESLLPQFYQCTAFLDASMKVPITADAIRKSEKLKLIVTATTGASHIDCAALEKRDVPLLTLKGQTDILNELTPAAEHSWALAMACARRLRGSISHVLSGGWERTDFPGLMLKGRTIGIIGMGRIGQWMARYANAFGMNILYFDPHIKNTPEYARSATLKSLLSESDIITIHVHLSEETKGMLGRVQLESVKEGAILVNTSRGEILDEIEVIEALECGRLGAVGLDVLTGEPDVKNNPLWSYAQTHENVIITPHIGGFCPDAVDKVVEYSAQRIRAYMDKI